MSAEKRILRARIRREALALEESVRRESDRNLFAQLSLLPEFRNARCLFLFAGVGTEPDTLPLAETLLAQGRRIALPRTLPERRMQPCLITGREDLRAGWCGILEPLPSIPPLERDQIDFVLVPALCYDRFGYRLGQGGGYYDRWLDGWNGFSAGLCRASALQDELPREAHDRRVKAVVTENQILRPGI